MAVHTDDSRIVLLVVLWGFQQNSMILNMLISSIYTKVLAKSKNEISLGQNFQLACQVCKKQQKSKIIFCPVLLKG